MKYVYSNQIHMEPPEADYKVMCDFMRLELEPEGSRPHALTMDSITLDKLKSAPQFKGETLNINASYGGLRIIEDKLLPENTIVVTNRYGRIIQIINLEKPENPLANSPPKE